MSSADLQVWVVVAESRTLGSFFFFFFDLSYQSSCSVEKEKQSQAHTGTHQLDSLLHPHSSMCSNTFLPKANANLMCMEIMYSES